MSPNLEVIWFEDDGSIYMSGINTSDLKVFWRHKGRSMLSRVRP